MQNPDHHHAIERATRLLYGNTTGTLLVDSVPYPMLYMVNPRCGSLTLTIERDMNLGEDIVLVIPEDTFDAPMRVSVDLSLDIDEEACDRFMAYHTEQPGPIWTRGRINFAKLHDPNDTGAVIDQSDLEIPNALIKDLPSLCKKLNSDPKALREVSKLLARTDIDDPIAVGVDRYGFDVRARFGVVRVEFPSMVEDAQQAEDVIAALYGGVS